MTWSLEAIHDFVHCGSSLVCTSCSWWLLGCRRWLAFTSSNGCISCRAGRRCAQSLCVGKTPPQILTNTRLTHQQTLHSKGFGLCCHSVSAMLLYSLERNCKEVKGTKTAIVCQQPHSQCLQTQTSQLWAHCWVKSATCKTQESACSVS